MHRSLGIFGSGKSYIDRLEEISVRSNRPKAHGLAWLAGKASCSFSFIYLLERWNQLVFICLCWAGSYIYCTSLLGNLKIKNIVCWALQGVIRFARLAYWDIDRMFAVGSCWDGNRGVLVRLVSSVDRGPRPKSPNVIRFFRNADRD